MDNNEMQEMIAERAAKELKGPLVVNLGIGIPNRMPKYINDDQVYIHTENGMLGIGPADPDNVDPNLVNSGKQPVSEMKGASYFDSAESFAMIRGGHVGAAVLGVLQADQTGRIANWSVPGKDIIGVGGAMDLLEGAQRVICTMSHTTKTGAAKILKECTYPITSDRKVDMVITELAVFKFRDGKMYLTELMPGATLEEVREKTEADYIVALEQTVL